MPSASAPGPLIKTPIWRTLAENQIEQGTPIESLLTLEGEQPFLPLSWAQQVGGSRSRVGNLSCLPDCLRDSRRCITSIGGVLQGHDSKYRAKVNKNIANDCLQTRYDLF